MSLLRLRPGSDAVTRGLLRCGAAAGPLFVTTFLVAGAARDGYDPLRHPVSSLALGPGGRVQTANFWTAGALYLAGSAGLGRTPDRTLRSPAGQVLVAAAALGLVGAGVFVTDPVSGYPRGTPDAPTARSTAGALHDLCAVPTFLGLPAAALLYGWRFLRSGRPGWALGSAGTAAGMAVTLGLSSAGFAQAPRFVHVAGLHQRICVTIGFGWLTAMFLRALRARGTAGSA